jgi:hypothetical protein
MGSIDVLLDRVRATIGQFVQLPADLSDVGVLKSQIELRQRALKEMGTIRCRLKASDSLRRQGSQLRLPVSAGAGRARNRYAGDRRRATRVRGQTSL